MIWDAETPPLARDERWCLILAIVTAAIGAVAMFAPELYAWLTAS